MASESDRRTEAAAITPGDVYRQARQQAEEQSDYDVQGGLDRLSAWMLGEPTDDKRAGASHEARQGHDDPRPSERQAPGTQAPQISGNADREPWPPGSLLWGLQEPARQRLLRLGTKMQYPAGRVLIREGGDSSSVFLLLAGPVKVTAATGEGAALLAIRVGGDIIGEFAALDDRPHQATVTTAGPVIAQAIGYTEFRGQLGRDPELALAVTRWISRKLRDAASRRIEFTGRDVTTSLAQVLLELAEEYGEQSPMGRTIGCPLTHAELAKLAGVAEATVHRSLRQLRADGIVASSYRQTTVLDMSALRRRALSVPS